MSALPQNSGVGCILSDGARAILETPESHYDIIQEGPFSTVSKTWVTIQDGEPQWAVVKSATTVRRFTKEPHDILKELRLLSSIQHPNIVHTLGSFYESAESIQNIYLPYLPSSLSDLLASPFFSPHPFPPLTKPDAEAHRLHEEQFTLIAKSIMFQALSALAFLHDASRKIAHRDIKPENIMLTKEGCVQLIDFGVAFKVAEEKVEKRGDLWVEARERLYFEVSTGAYRAPELLFGCRTYDPLAIDLWSLGATFAAFFTPLRLSSDDTDDGEDDDDLTPPEDTVEPLEPFIVPKYLRIGYPGAQWRRDSLFNGERGEIGLAWSIFKIMGTPTKENWPEFDDLPGSKSVVFRIVSSIPLVPLLPNLPLSPTSSAASASNHTNPSLPALDLLTNFLKYPVSARLPAKTALRHIWFTHPSSVVPLLLPQGYTFQNEEDELRKVICSEWKGKSLQEWLEGVLMGVPES